MKDPVFRQALDGATAERKDLAKARGAVVAKMTAMIEAKKKELKTDDLEKVKAALDRDPEWKSLYQRCLDANQALEENHQKALDTVRRQMTQKSTVKETVSK